MATNPQDDRDADDTAPTPGEAHKLTSSEGVALLRESGGYAVIRYDCIDDHIEYRYNPSSGTFEQAVIDVDADNGEQINQYYRLSSATMEQRLARPGSRDLLKPELVAFHQSHFANIDREPDTFRSRHHE